MPLRSLWWKWQVSEAARRGGLYTGYLQTDAAYARAVVQMKLPEHGVFFGYSYSSLEVLREEKRNGKLCILDQIDPGAPEFRLVAEEMRRHPELNGLPPELPTAYYDRNRREWEIADVIVVNSEWTRDAIVAEGASPEKIEILPLAYESKRVATRQQEDGAQERQPMFRSRLPDRARSATLRVLWLGQVNVRKGIHYLIEAARLLQTEHVEFDVVGSIGISEAALNSAPRNMRFHGSVSRDCAAGWYRQSDVFVLPTLSDGFAITQLEAFAHCLPVITTPNCGRVVEDGKTGFVIPPRDPEALAEAVMQFVRNRSLVDEMFPRCQEAINAYSIDSYGQRLVEIIDSGINRRKHS
jgi:glycosyltransferase involved in cell wall biosynthesis